jgi:3-hydroxyisobutyrate dehydrogenase-like beta-hydroxyacid dehydrogenase
MPDRHSNAYPAKVGETVTTKRLATAPDHVAGSERKPVEGTIGFIGLGHMGGAMAANLAASGCKITGYVREPGQAQPLKALGVESTNDRSRLFACDFVISMVPDDVAAHEIVFGREQPLLEGLASGLKTGAIHVSMSTISPTTSSEIAAEHTRRGQGYVAAPVLGNPDAAKARELFIVTAGQSDQVERCRPIFDLLGQRTFVIGSDPASANLVKLAGNVMTATTLEVLGEVIALLRKRGVEPEKFLDVMTSTMFGSRVHRIYGAKIVQQRYAPGFAFPLALKDVRLALSEADAAGVPMPSVDVVHERLITGVARGHGKLDWSALALVSAEEAGLESDSLKSGA